MNKKENNISRIDVIKQERKEMLEEVRESVQCENKNVFDNIEDILEVIKSDEQSVKKYEALKSAQELICKLTEEIVNATSKEEIDNIRKKLNYYINKIKKEALKRNIDYIKCNESITNMRKDISKYIRLLKKQNEIDEIKLINNNYELLTEDDKKKLARQISNSRNYNKRMIREKSNPVCDKVEIEESNIPIEDKSLEETKKNSGLDESTIVPKRQSILRLPRYESDDEFISQRVNDFNSRYKLKETHEYSNSVGKNIFNFIRNLPIYAANKKAVKKIVFDYSIFYRGDDLGIYLEYVKRNNSIAEGIKGIFGKSSLYTKENIHLDNHDRCVQWIMDVIKNNNIKLQYY